MMVNNPNRDEIIGWHDTNEQTSQGAKHKLINDLWLNFYASGDYSADWSTVSLPSSPVSGQSVLRYNTNGSILRMYYYSSTSWEFLIVPDPAGSTPNHNDLGAIQGGTTNEFYHFTSIDYSNRLLKTDSTTDLPEGTNEYYTESKVSANTSVAANTTHSGLITGNPHSIDAGDISDFDTEVSNNTSVAANTTHSGLITGNPHSVDAGDISDFDTEVSNNTSVAANTTHRSSGGTDHSDVFLLDGSRSITGETISDLTSMFINENLAHYDGLSENQVGTIKITLPTSWTSTMMTLVIEGYDYNDDKTWSLLLGGYNWSSSSIWVKGSATLIGDIPDATVRLAHDGTKCCILIGTLTTSWDYAKIILKRATTAYSNYSQFKTGWTITRITSESGITVSETLDAREVFGARTFMNNMYLGSSSYYLKSDGDIYAKDLYEGGTSLVTKYGAIADVATNTTHSGYVADENPHGTTYSSVGALSDTGGTYFASDYPRKAEVATITSTWTMGKVNWASGTSYYLASDGDIVAKNISENGTYLASKYEPLGTSSDLEAYLGIGSSNAIWKPCYFLGASTVTHMGAGSDGLVSNDTIDNTNVYWNSELPLILNSKNLYINALRINIYDADSLNYVDQVKLTGFNVAGTPSSSELYNSTTDRITTGVYTYTFTSAEQIGTSYHHFGIRIYTVVGTIGALDIANVEIEYYYA